MRSRPVVFIPCPVLPSDYAGWLFQILGIIRRNERAFDFKLIFRPVAPNSGGVIARVLADFIYALKAWRQIHAERKQAIVVFPVFFFANVILSFLLAPRVPYVVRVSGGELVRGNRFVYFLRRRMIQKSACAIVLNRSDFVKLGDLGLSSAVRQYIPNPVDHTFRSPNEVERRAARSALGFASADVVIGIVGTQCVRKGQLDLVRAVAHLGLANTVVVLCGPASGHGEADGEYLRLCAAEAAASNQTLIHIEFARDVRAILWSLDIFVLPSLSEGMPNSLLEAMGCGCACVASDIPGVSDIISNGHNGILVKPGSPADLAAALDSIIQDKERATSLGQAAESTVRRDYSPERIDSEYLSLFRWVWEQTESHQLDGERG
ncbi:MAG TPA: glycosyltransferase family 4 protein [Candidatus Accumulibacter phosphatis]|nr:glycosyltransferase family 4 protein [Candidatus Accumulibacter phosphatis]